jgi:hypothetical protein
LTAVKSIAKFTTACQHAMKMKDLAENGGELS